MTLDYTGERFVPGKTPSDLMAAEHVSRYQFASRFARNTTVLDLGCGTGYGSFLLSQTAKEVVGSDIDLLAIKYASVHYRSSNLLFAQMDCRCLGLPNRTFDLVVSFETIEHITKQQQMLSEIQRILTRQGIVIISTPDRVRYNADKKTPNPYHLRELSETEFSDLLRLYFPCVKILWQNVDPLVFQIRQMSRILGSLEKRIKRMEQIEQHPFRYLLKRFLPNALKTRLRSLPGVESRAPEAINQTVSFSIWPGNFRFSSEATPEAKYMVAVCSYEPISDDADTRTANR